MVGFFYNVAFYSLSNYLVSCKIVNSMMSTSGKAAQCDKVGVKLRSDTTGPLGKPAVLEQKYSSGSGGSFNSASKQTCVFF